MPPSTIRPALPTDVGPLAELAQRAWSDAFGAGVDDEAAGLESRSPAYFANALEDKVILVAEERGALVGYVQFGDVAIPEVDSRPGDAEIERLYVETALQGRGIGRLLLEAALAHPRLATARRVFLQVWEENTRAVALYESVGFRRVGTTAFMIGSQPMEDLVMLLERS